MSSVKILVDLDCILDTRLGVAETLQPGLVNILLGNDWAQRTRDNIIWELGNFTEAEYKEAYGRRDYKVLAKSLRTGVPSFIDHELTEFTFTQDVDKGEISYAVNVNIFPYLLSKAEADELIRTVLIMIPSVSKVDLYSIDPRGLTGDWLVNAGYTHYYTYDINSWLKRHSQKVIMSPVPRLSVIGPRLRENELDELSDKEKELAMTISPWESMEQSFSLYLMLRYIDVAHFCLDPR